jgi:hypothetical protein
VLHSALASALFMEVFLLLCFTLAWLVNHQMEVFLIMQYFFLDWLVHYLMEVFLMLCFTCALSH